MKDDISFLIHCNLVNELGLSAEDFKVETNNEETIITIKIESLQKIIRSDINDREL